MRNSETAPEPRHFVVLVVEDDAAIRRLLVQAALDEPGMRGLTARDAFVAKPFGPDDLMARLRGCLRHAPTHR
ncbi:MAG TPA: hypothetical protein VG370_05810 [Chloroflexota bacterium]|nr:hypothetical protein [Chloroflexota bacterium]